MITKICLTCKRKFKVHNYRENTSVYCSYKCKWIGKQKRFQKICSVCKKKFVTKFKRQVFCSRQCSGKSYQTSIVKKCLNCGKEISVKPCRLERTKYCSKKCQNFTQKQILKGKNNPFYGKKHTIKTRRKIKNELKKKRKEGWSIPIKRGNEHPQFKGILTQRGYVYIYQPFHPRTKKNGYVKRANLVMEKMIGRFLEPKEIVHHKGVNFPVNSLENRGDDRPENLQLFANESKHHKFHNPYGFNPKRKIK